MSFIKVKMTGHDYRYDIFQILVLFFKKDDISFICEDDSGDANVISSLDKTAGEASCIMKYDGKQIEKRIYVDMSNKRKIKNGLKISLLECIEELGYDKVPWGILIGIRPTKIIHEYTEEGLDDDVIISKFMNEYRVRLDKAQLALEVARNEAPFLRVYPNSVSMYIHIPFCPSKCIYCSFSSIPVYKNEELIEHYLLALFDEIDAAFRSIKSKGLFVDTLYIGGGTPSVLSCRDLDRLLSKISQHCDLKSLNEFTIECGRPDSIDKDKLSIIKNYGCTRISINPQTMNEETLKTIGRNHTTKDIEEKFYIAREIGFDDINMDIIMGLPGEDERHVEKTMKSLKEISPDSITIHIMAYKRASILLEKGVFKKNNLAETMYEIAIKHVKEMGMHPYYMYRQKNMVSPLENVGYCFKNKECIYNIQMIAENITIVALGAGSVTKLVYPKEKRIERVANLRDVKEYIERKDEMIEKKRNAIEMI